MSVEAPTSAYVHIPFCRRRCYYCDFPVSVVGDRAHGSNSGAIAQYVDNLCQEIIITPALGQPLKTIFFGGGTPSLLSVPQLERILTVLNQQFGIAAGAEISMEMDPGTFDLAQIQGYRLAGVNRISLGVQAFQNEVLQACGRTHTVEDITVAVELIHQTGVSNYSLDLISGLPHLTLDHWEASLQRAIALEPAHLSIYDLIVEPMTAFGRWYQPGAAPLPPEDATADMYRMGDRVLTAAGFEHYEISNYARPGYQCQHNRVYWKNQSYYGFGMGAASYVNGQRYTRPRTRREYIQWVEDLKATAGQITCPPTPPNEVLLETLMLGLRLAEGLNLCALAQQFGEECLGEIWIALQPYFEEGWVALFDADRQSYVQPEDLSTEIPPGTRVQLSRPDGFLFSNVVLTALFERLS